MTSEEDHKLEDDLKQSVSGLSGFIKNLFSVDQVNFVQATENIKKDVSFKGFNIWILICSILICSLGLNLNSTAVVIGAMLISPLMGPINGLGLAIGTFDRVLMRKSLINLAIATVVSILTAAIFFRITPTADNLHELFSRTKPIVLDLFVAFFGGVAGILAASRCLNTNVVPGVAIATALMPPLCTAGYGLATLQMDYFLGAFYLFFMNCVMISLAAILIVLYLKYPKYSFVDDRKRRRVKNGILAFVLILSVPSVIIYYNLLRDSAEGDRVEAFIESEFKTNSTIYVSSFEREVSDTSKIIKVVLNGKHLSDTDVKTIQSKLSNYKLNDYTLLVYQSDKGLLDDELVGIGEKFKVDILADLYEKNDQKLQNKEDEIEFLKHELRRIKLNNIAIDKLAELVQSQFDINEIAVDNMVYIKANKLDTIPTVLIRWQENIKQDDRDQQYLKMKELLRIQLERDDILLYELK